MLDLLKKAGGKLDAREWFKRAAEAGVGRKARSNTKARLITRGVVEERDDGTCVIV